MRDFCCWPRGLTTLLLAILLLLAPGITSLAHAKRPDPILILHDSTGPFGWIGDVHARMLANLLGHFDVRVVVQPVEEYAAGSIERSRAVFYLGTTYNNALPETFLREASQTSKTVCWFKYNLWQLGTPSSLVEQYGFRFDYLDASGYNSVSYKGETFGKNALDPEVGRTTILDPTLATAAAWICGGTNGDCIPYAVRGGNLWYVADTPFTFIGEEDRYVVFCDLLHDILGVPHAEVHRALIRIEDVDAWTSPEAITRLTGVLTAEGVPFLLNVIPVRADPLGHFHGGVPLTVGLSQTPALQQALRDAVARGGQIVLHGYTHQYDSVPNPFTGVSGDDFEFFRVTLDAEGHYQQFEPVPEDSHRWARSRVVLGLRELRRAGFRAAAWCTPHYTASPIDYLAFGNLFRLTVQRAIYFEGTGDVSLRAGGNRAWRKSFTSGSRYAGQFFPYLIEQDIYGQKIVPENLGHVDLPVLNGSDVRRPADLIRVAHKGRVVRDGWASGFFHPFLDPALLTELIQGIKAEGYTFVGLTKEMH